MLMEITLLVDGETINRHRFEATYEVHIIEGMREADRKFREDCPGISIFSSNTSLTLTRCDKVSSERNYVLNLQSLETMSRF